MTDDVLHGTAKPAATARFHRGHALGIAALVTPFAQAYSWPIVTPIMVLAALGVLIAVRGRLARPPLVLAGLLVALAAYGAVTGLWALSDKLALKAAWTIIATAIPGLVLVAAVRRLDPAERAWFDACLVAGFVIGLANMEVLLLTGGEVFDWLRQLSVVQALFGLPVIITLVMFDTQMSLISLLIWPVVAVVYRRHGLVWAALIAAAGFAVVLQGLSGTAKLAYVVGAAALGAAWLFPRWSAAALGAVLALWIGLAPLLYESRVMDWGTELASRISPRISNSMVHRRAIWDFTVQRIHDRPVLGWGLGNSRIMPGSHQDATVGEGERIKGLELMPLHPHNAALQLWLELGLPGVLLGVVFVGWIALIIGRLAAHPVHQALAVALVAAILVNAASGYNLWHTWWMTFIWLAAIFLMAGLASAPAEPQSYTDRLRKPGRA